jgi:hypothetical protein
MTAATALAILFVPTLYVIVQKLAERRNRTRPVSRIEHVREVEG